MYFIVFFIYISHVSLFIIIKISYDNNSNNLCYFSLYFILKKEIFVLKISTKINEADMQ